MLSRLAAMGCILAATALASPLAAAHAALKASVPAADAVLDAAPKEIALTFNEKIETAFSSAAVKDAAGNAVATGKPRVDAANPAVMHIEVPALAAGAYKVEWVAVGRDGHRRTGAFKFSVK
ncbi:copper resistance protein CopC [Massilia cavernae]|uniref:Copper resistance protein CopC n=2 Tax=Massilia cavernae TaxID=2320864 RepID=A0A418XY08_9BURK|nr:copper resistance protein CopC [Massilia cavernae]